MRRATRSRLLAGGGALAVALAAAACGGSDASPPAPSDTTTTGAALTVQVVDGDTREPLPGAAVTGVSTTNVAGPTVATGPDGRADLPAADVGGVCADIATHSKECRTVGAERTDLTIPLYNPNLASPEYGGGPARTRYVPAVRVPPPAGPPTWRHTGKALLEFPPAVARGVVVLATNRGRVFAFDARTGRVRWQKRHTTTNNIASTPAITPDGRQAIVSGMDGRLVSYALTNGEVLWDFDAGQSPIESSPLVVGNTVYVGAHNGLMYAVDITSGDEIWRFQASDDIKSSAALAGNNLIFGDYSGNVYAIRAGDGQQVWRQRHGQKFYGGAAISRGIAVLGDVGGGVVAINVSNGRQIWHHPTGVVYASPAIAQNTVFIGSYDENFYALDLESGDVKWTRPLGARISGSATVVGNTVYTSVLARPGERDATYGLDTRNGTVRWEFDDGRYSAGVAAGRTLFIVGRTNLYAYRAP